MAHTSDRAERFVRQIFQKPKETGGPPTPDQQAIRETARLLLKRRRRTMKQMRGL